MAEITREEWKKLVRIVKGLKQEVADQWQRLNDDIDAQIQVNDETREIAERARRQADRVAKALKEMEDD